MTTLFDENDLQALREHDPSAEERLFSVFAAPVKCALRKRLRCSETIEDACQETFLRVLKYFRQGKTLRSPQNLAAFIRAVSTRVSLELLRFNRRSEQFQANAEEPEDHRADPERVTLLRERKKIVHSTLSKLSGRDEWVLRRVFLEEADKNEVCNELHATRNHLRVVLHRARQQFKLIAENGACGI